MQLEIINQKKMSEYDLIKQRVNVNDIADRVIKIIKKTKDEELLVYMQNV